VGGEFHFESEHKEQSAFRKTIKNSKAQQTTEIVRFDRAPARS
jgi:hypothetical protein